MRYLPLLLFFACSYQEPKPIIWELTNLAFIKHGCLDTMKVPSWHRDVYATQAYLAFERVKKQTLEEYRGKARILSVKQSGITEKISEGFFDGNELKMVDEDTREIYELKILKRTDKYLALMLEPDALEIYFNTVYKADSLSGSEVNNLFILGHKLFNKKTEYCK